MFHKRYRGFGRSLAFSGIASMLAFGVLGYQNANAQISNNIITYLIEPMSLDAALYSFAEQSDLQILFSPVALENLKTDGLTGSYSPQDALNILLEDSGFEYVFTSENFVVIRSVDLKTNSNIGNSDNQIGASLQPLELENQKSVSDEQNTRQPFSNHEVKTTRITKRGALSGQVKSSVNGQPLAGASLSLPKLSIMTVSDENGFYSFNDVPSGDYILFVKYFGHRTERFDVNIQINGPTEFEIEFGEESQDEIIVTGVRSAYNNSINSQRAFDNVVSILAADLDGRFPDNTVAEALRRAPGISFERDERGGEGEYVSIRGIKATYNAVTINGQAAAAASLNDDRRIALDSLLADSVSKIVVHKTLLPHQSSVGIGGLVDIRTIDALSSKERKLSVTTEGRYSEFNDKVGFLASGRYSDTFGVNDEFGIFASASFRRRLLRTYQFDVIGSIFPKSLPIGFGGLPIDDIDDLSREDLPAESLFNVEDLRFNVFDDQRDVFGLNLGGKWQLNNSTEIKLTMRYNALDVQNKRSGLGFEQRDNFTNINTINGQLVDPSGQYFFTGRNPFIRQRSEVEDEISQNAVIFTKARTRLQNLTLNYGGGYSSGRVAEPLSTEIDFQTFDLDQATPPHLPSVSPTGNRFIEFDLSNPFVPAPQFTQNGFDFIANRQNFRPRDVFIQSNALNNDIYTAHLDASYEFDAGALKKIQGGLSFSQSHRLKTKDIIYDGKNFGPDGSLTENLNYSLAETSLLSGNVISLSPINNPAPGINGIPEVDRSEIIAFRNRLISSLSGQESRLFDTVSKSSEQTLEGYFSGEFALSQNLMIMGGVRFDYNRGQYLASRLVNSDQNSITTTYRADPSASREQHNTEILPRFILSYRPDENWLFKAGYFESIARPTYNSLNRPETIDIDLDAGKAEIESAGQTIENIHAKNFDVSAQYYGSGNSFFELNAYFKTLTNYRFSDFGDISANFELTMPADINNFLFNPTERLSTDLGYVTDLEIQTPVKGTYGAVYGIDISALYQFKGLSGVWDGLGVRASASLQDTNFSLRDPDGRVRDLRFTNAPSFAGTLGLWYEKEYFNAYAIYSYQGRQLNSIEARFPDEYVQPYSALDLRFEYKLPTDRTGPYKLYIAVSDILDNGLKPTTHETIGTSKRLLDDVEFNGREIRFGLQAEF